MKIRNFTNHNGRDIPNQFILTFENGTAFQSYKSMIAVRPTNGKIKIDVNYWNYSRTTGKYRNLFLGETKRETEKKIKSGEYILVDLNE